MTAVAPHPSEPTEPAPSGADPPATAPERIVSRDKAFGRILGSVPATRPEEVQGIADRAAAAAPAWAARPIRDRLAIVARARALLIERMDPLADLVARETGKTIVEAIPMEIIPPVDTCRWLEVHAERFLRSVDAGTPQLILAGRRHELAFEPYGVVGVISPWNYPLTVASAAILFNLAAGNAVVHKPSSNTPLIGQAFRDLLVEAGVPPDVMAVVQGGAAVGEALVAARGVEKIFFTGSEPVGRRVMELAARAAGHPKPVVLELGGKDAMVVLRDADLDRAAVGAAWAGFGHAGQTCGSVKRLYVDQRVAADFERRLAARVGALRPGDPLDPDTQLGAMAHATTRDAVSGLIRDALDRGARLVAGGPDAIHHPGAEPEAVGHLPATLLADVPPDARLWEEELFGPVIVLATFRDEAEAVALANDSPFGLSASVWSRDLRRARRIAERLDAGTILINDHLTTAGISQVAWAGRRASGFGISRSRFGLWECVQVKSIATDRGIHDPAWWHPYDRRLGDGFRTALAVLYGDGGRRRLGALVSGRDGLRGLVGRLARSARRSFRSRRAAPRNRTARKG
jgi:acyl-CoA reductase-like NAD-dependent aldehyde dehydrogenase